MSSKHIFQPDKKHSLTTFRRERKGKGNTKEGDRQVVVIRDKLSLVS